MTLQNYAQTILNNKNKKKNALPFAWDDEYLFDVSGYVKEVYNVRIMQS
jgi:hypothetical protein